MSQARIEITYCNAGGETKVIAVRYDDPLPDDVAIRGWMANATEELVRELRREEAGK